MVVLVVDQNEEVAKDHFVQYVRECSNGKVFMVAVFAADQDRKTVDPALLSGIDAWFVTSSQKKAVEIANGMGVKTAEKRRALFVGSGKSAGVGFGDG